MADIKKFQPAAGFEVVPAAGKKRGPVVYTGREHTAMNKAKLLREVPILFCVRFKNREVWRSRNIWRCQICGRDLSSGMLFRDCEGPCACPATYIENRADMAWKWTGVEMTMEGE